MMPGMEGLMQEPKTELDELVATAEEMVGKFKQARSALKEQLASTEENLIRWDARLVTLRELKESGFSRFLKPEEEKRADEEDS